jgi:hypothetical protein
MAHWHGAVASKDFVPGADCLPAVLRRFYQAYGTAADAFLVNRLLPPAEVRADDGFIVFYVEEQAVYLWGIAAGDLATEDPPVWCRENDPGKPWVQDAPSISVFLVQMLVMSAALNGPHAATAAWLTPDEAERVLAALQRLELPPWHWPGPGAQWYAGDEAVAFVAPNVAPGDVEESPHVSVWVSSLTEDGIEFIEPHLSEAWDYYSPRDG